jgi:hypothetical protein
MRVAQMVKNFWDKAKNLNCKQLKISHQQCPKLSHQFVPSIGSTDGEKLWDKAKIQL